MLYEGLISQPSATISTQVGACGEAFGDLNRDGEDSAKYIIGLR